jgi:hypothetical protein
MNEPQKYQAEVFIEGGQKQYHDIHFHPDGTFQCGDKKIAHYCEHPKSIFAESINTNEYCIFLN